MLKVGIEQEFVFADKAGRYVDADNTAYPVFSDIVDAFPAFAGDDRYLDCKSLENYPKRCYVEGFELHDHDGTRVETLPKGLEIRTIPHTGVEAAVEEFRNSFTETMRLAEMRGFSPLLVSRHPFKSSLERFARLPEQEERVRTKAELEVARRAMFTHGLHVNVSLGLPAEEMQILVEKVNYYSPALIPWSFSSPFYDGKAFDGLCNRNYFRADARNMTELRQRHGECVLEYRAFDACGDTRLLEAVLKLFCGFVLDKSLPGKAPSQEPGRLKLSSMVGFGDPTIRKEGLMVLRAAQAALNDDGNSLDLLENMLKENDSYAARMKRRYVDTASIMECIAGQYDFG